MSRKQAKSGNKRVGVKTGIMWDAMQKQNYQINTHIKEKMSHDDWGEQFSENQTNYKLKKNKAS